MYKHKIEVRFSDFDSMGHVNNAVFLTYLEIARINYIQKLMKDNNLDHHKYGFILAHVSIDYKKAIEVQYITAEIMISKVGTTSFDFSYRLYDDQNIYAIAKSIQVMYDYKAKNKIPIPVELKNILENEKVPK